MTLAFNNTRRFTPMAASRASLARCPDVSREPWYLVLALIRRPAPQFNAPVIGRLDTGMHDRIEEEAERWDGLS